MYIVRETFTAKPGKASALAALFKTVMADVPGHVRVMTDAIGPFNTVVIDTEVEDLAAFEAMMRDYAARTDIRDKMQGYTDMYQAGRREVFRVV
jgi:fumarylacetoacetate (FAA) hydrolase family protein